MLAGLMIATMNGIEAGRQAEKKTNKKRLEKLTKWMMQMGDREIYMEEEIAMLKKEAVE